MNSVKAMILAGGKGKRMDVLCQVRPKPALPFAGRFRVIDFTLSNCIHSGVGDIAVLTDYQRSNMANYLKRWRSANDVVERFDVLDPKTGSYSGTADAVYQNLSILQKPAADRVLILAGDHVYSMDYRQMLAFHEQTGADVTVGVVTVPFEQVGRFGTVTLDDDGRIVDFIEKSATSPSNLASMGIYVFNKDILVERLNADAAEPDSPHDFGYAILPSMVKQDRVFAYRFDGYWQDIGTIEAYYEANMQLIQKQPSTLHLDGDWTVLTESTKPVEVKSSPQGNIENSLISPGCVIKGRVENSILSPGVFVEEEAIIRNSILMPNVFVGYHSMVDSCILDEGVNIGKNCYIGSGNGQLNPAACTVLGQGITVPSYTAIGSNCRIAPYSDPAPFSKHVIRDYNPLGVSSSPAMP